MRTLDAYGQQLLPGLRRVLQEKPGSLVLCDSFEGTAAHGRLVAEVVSQAQFPGQVVAVPFEDERDPAQTARSQRLAESVQAWGTAGEPAAVRHHLAESILNTRLNALESATARLTAIAASGGRNLAVNLSLGSTPALCVAAVLQMCQDPQSSQQALRQLALGFGLPRGTLRPDSPELHSSLVQTARATDSDPRLLQARCEFAEAVRAVEANHSSVVVAAGNDGNLSLLCPTPTHFTRSDLVTPDTTVVGALENGQPAAYNGDLTSINIYAPGAASIPSLNETVHGTSFAAPRVAAALARLHGQHPELSSAQVESLVSLGDLATGRLPMPPRPQPRQSERP